MEKRRLVWLMIACLAVLAAGTAIWFRANYHPEPVYQGRPLSYWLNQMSPRLSMTRPVNARSFFQAQMQAQAAVSHIGTNAIPTLLRMLEAQDSSLKLRFYVLIERLPHVHIRFARADDLVWEAQRGFQLLGRPAAVAVPDLINIYQRNSSIGTRQAITAIFSNMGPAAKEATPLLLHEVGNPDAEVRNFVINALRKIRPEPGAVVPVLINALQDSSGANRTDACYALAIYGTNANAAVGPLVELLNDPFRNIKSRQFDVGFAVGVALLNIDPAAAARAGVKP